MLHSVKKTKSDLMTVNEERELVEPAINEKLRKSFNSSKSPVSVDIEVEEDKAFFLKATLQVRKIELTTYGHN